MSEGEYGELEESQDEPAAPEVTYELKSVSEAANLLKISESTVWRYVAQDILPAYRVGKKRVMFRPSDLEGLLSRVRKRKEPVVTNKALRLLPISDGSSDASAAITRAREVRERILASRGGVPTSESWIDINEAREERTADL